MLISPYSFAVQTLVGTLIDLGADYVSTHQPNGNAFIWPHGQDTWAAGQAVHAVQQFAGTGPMVGAITDKAVLSILPPRIGRIVIAAVPDGYVVAFIDGVEGWASQALARKLADAIESWVAQHHNQHFPHWTARLPRSRFYPGL